MGCPICLNDEAAVATHPTRDASVVDCPQCFKFTISRSAEVSLRNIHTNERWKISAWLVQYKPEIFTASDLELALKASAPGLMQRANRMLKALKERFPQGYVFSLPDVSTRLTGVGWNRNAYETRVMLEDVLKTHLGFLQGESPDSYRITTKGFLHLEGMIDPNSNVGFCAMWFSDEVKPLWTDVIEPAIRSAGYEPLRIDGKQHNNKIDDEIIASIRSALFLIADFTDHRGGVYYEAGMAHGLGLPVIFMCRSDDMEELHFDIRQYNCIIWKADVLEDAQTRLKNRILATLGQGPLKI